MACSLFVCHMCLVVIVGVRVSSGFWRYRNALQGSENFNTREKIVLEYAGAQTLVSILWSAEEPCNITNGSFVTAYLSCPEAGIYEISATTYSIQGNMTINQTSSKSIEVKDLSGCFAWFVKYGERSLNISNGGQIYIGLTVWIFDPLYCNEDERNHTAQKPCPYSSVLTEQFHLMGQAPNVSINLRSATGAYSQGADLESYDTSGRFWSLSLHITHGHVKHNSAFTVKGKPIALYECFIRDTVIKYKKYKFPALSSESNSSILLKGADESLSLILDPCSGDVALAVSSGKVFITQDGFTSVQLLRAPGGYTGAVVADAIVLTSHLLVLLLDGKLWVLDANSTTFRKFNGDRAHIKASRMVSYSRCVADLGAVEDVVLLWNETSISYFSFDDRSLVFGLPMNMLKELAGTSSDVEAKVMDVSPDVVPGRIGVAMKLKVTNGIKVLFGMYDVERKIWSLSPFWMDYPSQRNDVVRLHFINSAKTSFYFHNTNGFFYSYDNGLKFGAKKLYSCNVSLLAINPDYIRNIIFSVFGDVSVQLHSGEVLYGRTKINDVIKLDTFVFYNSTSSAYWFDELGQLFLVSLSATSSVKFLIPVKQEVKAALGRKLLCQYQYFYHGNKDLVYYMDMNGTLNIWATIVYKNWKPNSIEVSISDGNLLSVSQKVIKEYYRDSVSETIDVMFTNEFQFSGGPNYEALRRASTQIVLLETRPKHADFMCSSRSGTVAYISVGCPPKRHIEIRRPPEGCKRDFRSFVIPGGRYFNASTRLVGILPTEVEYDWDTLGCPIEVEDTDLFLPMIDLYDESMNVSAVAVDYVVWEVNGRTDFSYSATMSQIGCVAQAQTWHTMMANTKSSDPVEIWGPHNYRSCYSSTNVAELPVDDLQYEVLNNDGRNSIKFSSDAEGIYIFRAIVVDPNYSYCNLSTTFALRRRIPFAEDTSTAIYLTNAMSVFILTVLLVLTYVWFHKHMSKMVKPKAADEPTGAT